MTLINLKVVAHHSLTNVPREHWDRLFPGLVESWSYFRACETAPPHGFQFGALGVYDGETLVAAAPHFTVNYRIDMSLPERLHPLGNWLDAVAPRLVNAKVLGLGSPLTEECPIGFEPRLSADERAIALSALLDGLAQHGGDIGASVLAIKDLRHADHAVAAPLLSQSGFASVPTLPVATLHLPFEDEAAYFASLKGPMRNELRRKLKALAHVDFSFPATVDELEDEIIALFEETKSRRKADYDDFDNVPPRYFRAVLEALGPEARLMVAHVGGQLASFNLLLIEQDRVIGKYLGMSYPMARDHNLYFLNWMMTVRLCLAERKSWLQTGHTGYRVKVRLGSRLKRSWVYFRHVNPVINVGFRTLGPRFPFDAMDPDLRELGDTAPYLDAPPPPRLPTSANH